MKEIVVNGRKSVEELIGDSHLRGLIKVVIISSTQKHLIELCKKEKVPYEIKPKDWFNSSSLKHKYKNAVAYLNEKKSITLNELIGIVKDKTSSIIVFLDKIHDPYNFGSILRTCAAAGVDGVVFAKHEQSPINSSVLKSSQGYALKVNLVEVTNLNQALESLKKYGYWSYSTNLEKDSKNYSQVEYSEKTIVIMGNEGHGVSYQLNKNADYQIYVPMDKSIDSLNVAVCTGIVVFEYLRQRGI